jgi:hypothetical protein
MGEQPKIIDAAIEAGVTHFYPSEFGGDIGREPFFSEPYFIHKHATRAHLAKVAKSKPSFKYTLLMCGAFVETFVMYDVFGLDMKAETMTFYGSPENTWSFSCISE